METLRGRQKEKRRKMMDIEPAKSISVPATASQNEMEQDHSQPDSPQAQPGPSQDLLKKPVPVPLRSLTILPHLKNPGKMSGHLAAPQS